MTSAEVTQLRLTYGEICWGYSQVKWGEQTVYVKHFNSFDQTEVDAFYDRVLVETVARGIKTEEQKLQWLDEKGLWTRGDQATINRDKDYIANLEKTKSQLPIKVQRDAIDVQLKEAQTKMHEMLLRRHEGLGKTAEWVADQKVQYAYVRLAFFGDPELRKPLFSLEDTLEFSEEEANDLINLYVGVIQRFSLQNLRRIAVQPFFTNYFYLCNKEITAFFGKPIINLTIQQVNLLSQGTYFKALFSNHDVPPTISDDPDKIEDFINQSKAGKAVIANTPAQGHRVGLVGWQQEDFEAAGVRNETTAMREAANKGYTNARDAAKDLGVNWTG